MTELEHRIQIPRRTFIRVHSDEEIAAVIVYKEYHTDWLYQIKGEIETIVSYTPNSSLKFPQLFYPQNPADVFLREAETEPPRSAFCPPMFPYRDFQHQLYGADPRNLEFAVELAVPGNDWRVNVPISKGQRKVPRRIQLSDRASFCLRFSRDDRPWRDKPRSLWRRGDVVACLGSRGRVKCIGSRHVFVERGVLCDGSNRDSA